MYIFYTRATIVMGQGLSQDWPGLDFLGLDPSIGIWITVHARPGAQGSGLGQKLLGQFDLSVPG